MDKAKIITKGKRQWILLPEKYQTKSKDIFFQEHELGLLIVESEKRWKRLEEIMGSMGDDFFPEGRDQVKITERDDINFDD